MPHNEFPTAVEESTLSRIRASSTYCKVRRLLRDAIDGCSTGERYHVTRTTLVALADYMEEGGLFDARNALERLALDWSKGVRHP